MDIDLKKVADEIKRLEEENKNYGNIKKNYVEIAKKLRGIVTELEEILLIVDPVKVTMKHKKRNYAEQIDEIYNRMKDGTQVTRELLQKTYDFSNTQAYTVMNRLRKLQGVTERRDKNRELRLFFH